MSRLKAECSNLECATKDDDTVEDDLQLVYYVVLSGPLLFAYQRGRPPYFYLGKITTIVAS